MTERGNLCWIEGERERGGVAKANREGEGNEGIIILFIVLKNQHLNGLILITLSF